MPQIRKLPHDVAARIAAGEVIERPVSVVKELLENSMDASSTRILVELNEGGKEMIRVEDDGSGIPAGELPEAVENFSTSKITGIDDIARVRTLGFRGEALASIRSVSLLTIRSRTEDDDVGREMLWKGNELVKDSPVVRNRGTEIIVRNLFFNLPARRKFLASGPSELRRITTLLQGFALSFPDTSFKLKDDGKEVLSYPPSTLKERVETVFGSQAVKHLKFFEREVQGLGVRGFASLPDLTRGNRSLQFYFVNSRNVRDRLLTHAVHQAYESLIPRNRYPLIALFLDASPEKLDVNVHPAKAEIRFRGEREVHRLVSSTLRDALQGSRLTFKEKVESVYRSIFPGRPIPGRETASGASPGAEGAGRAAEGAEAGSGWLLQETPVSLFGEERGDEPDPAGRLYWQLHESFIMIQIRGGLVIVDQHAAHERILFNMAKRCLGGERAAVQALLFPATLELSPDEYERLEELSGTLPSLGFEVEPFGARSVIVRGIPAGVRNWNEGHLLQEILGEREAGKRGIEEFLKAYACRSAVKAGTRLSVEEMESLTDQLFATDFPFTCPHGRPTMLRVETSELERRFQRTSKSER